MPQTKPKREPRIQLTADEAVEDMRGFELIAVEKHYGAKFSALTEGQQLCGVIWVFENRTAREAGQRGADWKAVENMTFGEMGSYFVEPDPDEVDSEQANFSEDSGSQPTN